MVIPLISHLKQKMLNAQVISDEGIVTKVLLRKLMEKRFKPLEGNKILVKSSFLDPRFKKIYISPIGVQEAVNDILKELVPYRQETRVCQKIKNCFYKLTLMTDTNRNVVIF